MMMMREVNKCFLSVSELRCLFINWDYFLNEKGLFSSMFSFFEAGEQLFQSGESEAMPLEIKDHVARWRL